MIKPRSDVPKEDRWNVQAIFKNSKDWQKEFDTISHGNQQPHWPQIAAFKGKLGESPDLLKSALETIMSIDRKLSLLYTYAHLCHDEELTDDQNKTAYSQITSVLHDFHQEVSWFEPELLALPNSTIKSYLSSPVLAPFRFHLEKVLRVKPHTLSADQESLLAMAGKPLQSVHKAFSAINDADFKFGKVQDEQGQEHELTHGLYGLYMRTQDRTLRKNTFLQLHSTYLKYENTLSELLNGQMQAHFFNARARQYSSCLDAALFPKNIDTSVYHALIDAVNKEMGALHKYVKLRKKLTKIKQLHLYDMQVPLVPNLDIKMSYKEAEELVIESVAPLGTEYQNILKKGLQEQRWVDRYENENKRSGAYSSGCYDSMPYILMNFRGTMRDVFTLAHEAGHSMHSYLSHKTQPYQYGDYPIFLAEVASTFNEDLLIRLLLQRAKSKEEKAFLINQKIEDIRSTLFRQTMFAEFELFMHEMVEKNIPLTPKLLREAFHKLNTHYFGKDVVIDTEAEAEWSRIPHFYYNFYVFQYATGISAAMALAERVINGGKKERDDYLTFLKGGSSRYPIEMLQSAGVDMRTPQPVIATISKFSELVDELATLL